MLIPKIYYRVGDKGCFKTEAAALLEAAALVKDEKRIVTVEVFKCISMRHDEVSMEIHKEDGNEFRVDDVKVLTNQPEIKWTDIKF